jgi:acyl dehydratase
LISIWPNGAPKVGDIAEMRRTVRATDIKRFTEISGDCNPLHYDPEAARASRFGEIVVQGGITSAILNAVVAEKLPGPGTVFLNVNWSFIAPVRPGDTITGRVEVTEVRSDKPITKLRTTVTRDDGTVVLEGTAVCYTMTTRLTEEATMSTTTGPEASGQNESQPDPREAEQPERQEKPVGGAEIGIMPEGQGSSFEPEEDPEAQS